jgi:preprotein translocase subunit SecE
MECHGRGASERAIRIFMANPFKFAQDVRAEVRKVTWPSRNETVVTTVMVFVLASLAAVFFFLVDQLLSWGVSTLLDLLG